MFNSCYAKARSLLAEEAAQKPAADLWGQHKQMIKLAQDNGLTLAANWAVNMSGRTFSEKPTKCEYINNKPECRRGCPSLCPANTNNDCNVGEKPPAHAKLVFFRDKVKHIFEDIMLNEDTEYDDAESVAVAIGELLQDTPTESIAEEPLEKLAKRKGVKFIHLSGGTLGFFFVDIRGLKEMNTKDFEYCFNTKAARQYLESLADKGGK